MRGEIAIVSPDPASEAGGVERFCHLLASALRIGGWRATITEWPPTDAKWDLVITNGMLGGPTAAPRVHVFHGSWVGHTMRGDTASSWHWRLRSGLWGCRREHRAGRGAVRVAVSESAAQEVARYYRLPVHYVVPNAVDTSFFRAVPKDRARAELGWPLDARIGLFAARAEHQKQPNLAVAAAHRAGLQLWSAGSTAPHDTDQHLGILDPPHLAVAFAAADCVLAPSLYEGCSLTVLEALAAGAPLVTTRVGWVPDLLAVAPTYKPLTADRGDDEGFCRAVARALATPALAGDAADYVRHRLNLQEWGRTWCTLVADVLAKRPRP